VIVGGALDADEIPHLLANVGARYERLRMHWRMKALTQAACSVSPGGAAIHRFLQERVTHSLPASPQQFKEMLDAARQHLAVVQQVNGSTDLHTLGGYEFGAGWHLGVAIAGALLGVGEQTLVDRYRLADEKLVRHTIDNISQLLDLDDRGGRAVRASSSDDLLRELGVTYLAPSDTAATGLDGESFEFASSTSTLEHVPKDEIGPLLTECHRLLRPGGVLTLMIDYKDHYAGFDPSCSPYNFLRFSERRWRKYSPSFHFQNRLRHSDYLRMVELAGFQIARVTTVDPTDADRRWLSGNEIDPSFDGYDSDDLLIRDSHIVATRPT
jgi:SAM-dependent methyltransferase